jgi:hypothetical protein
MSEQAPPNWFDQQSRWNDDDPELRKRKARLIEDLKRFQNDDRNRGRVNSFYPYLLARSVLGDRGDRPINVPFWESPDIWTAPGEPANAPAIPTNHGGTAIAGQPNTLYAHVWNLGLAPLAGVSVEFYWFDPSLAITGANANLIGIARCDLSSRGMNGSHLLVKCPKAWVPVVVNGGHECLVVRISGIGDPIGNNPWSPWLNRHVAQRNIAVVQKGPSLIKLFDRLNLSRLANSHLEFAQVGPREAEMARAVAAPAHRLRALTTHVLAGLDIRDRLIVPERATASPAMRAPVHPLAKDVPPAPIRKLSGVRILPDLHGEIDLARFGTAETDAPASTHIGQLLRYGELHQEADRHDRLMRGEVAALRLASYQGDQLVGGYTLLVAGGD